MYKLYETKMQYNMPFLATLVQKSKQIQPKTEIFHFSKISVFGIFMGGFQVKSAFWWQFNNKIDHNKCTPLKKNIKFCIFGKSQFHQIQPNHDPPPDHALSQVGILSLLGLPDLRRRVDNLARRGTEWGRQYRGVYNRRHR